MYEISCTKRFLDWTLCIVLITTIDAKVSQYNRHLISNIKRDKRWDGKYHITGFIDVDEVACLLASADSVIFPFKTGITQRNGSFMAARLQGSFVVATSYEKEGYYKEENVFYALPNDIKSMKKGLLDNINNKKVVRDNVLEWSNIAQLHVDLYKKILSRNVCNNIK